MQGAQMITIAPTDEAKNLSTLSDVWTALQHGGASRRSLLVNLGGGMLTDLGGFAASTFKRGIQYINVPTTLLAQVDASVGGKTGVDLGGLKNIVGHFTLPDMVLVSGIFLPTLPEYEILSGFAEMIKHGMIRSRSHWEELSSSADFDINTLEKLIYDSVHIKYDVVLEDPREKNIRKSLNFGHTIGHAIESFLMKTDRAISHGHAVAIGMVCECYLSIKECGLSEDFVVAFKEYICGIYPVVDIKNEELDEIMDIMSHDKKNSSKGINFSLLKSIGDVSIDHYIPQEDIKNAILFYTYQ
jgi:3-dehydroquinate synthase